MGRKMLALCSAALVASMLQPAMSFGVSGPAWWRRLPGLVQNLRALPPTSVTCRRRGAAALNAKAPGEDPALRKNPELYSETRPGATLSEAPAKTTGAVFKSSGDKPLRRKTQMVKPEVLSPAGGWPQLRAAVQNGADACYFGLSDFNARARASNFDP